MTGPREVWSEIALLLMQIDGMAARAVLAQSDAMKAVHVNELAVLFARLIEEVRKPQVKPLLTEIDGYPVRGCLYRQQARREA